jgi:PAS domain S-box-containing protein
VAAKRYAQVNRAKKNSGKMKENKEDFSSYFYQQASKLARIGSWEFDVAGDKIYWSNIVHELHETNPNTFIPDLRTSLSFYRGDFRSMVNGILQNSIKTGAAFDFEAVIVTKKKKERWVRAIGNVEMIEGKCQRIYGSFQDIHVSKMLELQIREILGSISDAFYAVDKNWKFTYFNKEAENLLLKKADEVLGKNIWELFPASADTSIRKIYQRVARTKNTESFEYYYPGNGKWYEINAYPSQGGVSAYFKNIDERKQAAEKLEKAYQEKINVLESIGDAFFYVNKDWVVTYWNKETEKVLGRKRDAIIGKNLWDEYPDVVETGFYRQYHKAMETQENLDFEEFYPALNMWLEVTVYPSTTGLSVYFKDITLRKESDIRLLQSNERFEKVAEATHDAIWDWNILENTLYWGAGFKNLFGYQIEKTTPTLESWSNHIHPEDREWVLKSFYGVLEKPDQSNWIAEYRYQINDGTFADVIDRGIVIRDEKGNPIRMVGAMNDITERKNFEISRSRYVSQIEIQNEKLKNIAWTQSHIVRAPLARMLGIMNVIEGNNKDLDDTLMLLKLLRDSANELDEIIKDMVAKAQTLDMKK